MTSNSNSRILNDFFLLVLLFLFHNFTLFIKKEERRCGQMKYIRFLIGMERWKFVQL